MKPGSQETGRAGAGEPELTAVARRLAQDCVAIIPCLNEGATIGEVVRGLRALVPRVLVVDDGSGDATGAEARAAGAEVLRHDRPGGKGAALRAGLAWARSRGATWGVLMDGDGQHDPADVVRFLEAAARGGVGLVVGNRMAAPAGMPWLRRQVNRWMSRRLSTLAGCRLPDTQCGFRLVRLEDWARLDLRTSHFEVESEMLLAFVRAGLGVDFVPIRVIYKAEQSKIHPWRDTVRWFRWLRGVGRSRRP